MENKNNHQPQDKIDQHGNSSREHKTTPDERMVERADDAGYTPEEDQFADGKGTQLNEELALDRGDIEDELSEQEDDLAEQKLEDEALDDDFENYKTDHKK